MDEVPWWRRPAVIGGSAAALVVLAVAAIALSSDESDPRQLAVRAGTTTSSSSSTTSTTPEDTTTTSTTRAARPTTSATVGRPVAPSTTAVRPASPSTTTATALRSPPAAIMRSSDGEVAGAQGSFCWRGDGPGGCGDTADLDPDQTLRVRQGTTVEVRWAIEEQPVSVQAKYTEGSGWVDVTPAPSRSNPSQLVMNFSPGVHRVAVFSQWSRGDVTHYFKVDVY